MEGPLFIAEPIYREIERSPSALQPRQNDATILLCDIRGCSARCGKKEYTCIGTAVNVAARLTAMAAPGQILISPGTYRKVAADIAADPMPEMVVKGIHSPMTVYRVC